MVVIILGGGGFIGTRLAKEILDSRNPLEEQIEQLVLVDLGFPAESIEDNRVTYKKADFSDEQVMRDILAAQPAVIFHLAAVVSGEAEKNLDLGMKVNFHASLQMLELCRELGQQPRIVFASSCAVYGGDTSKVIIDETSPKPRSSYGTQKAMVELLINDYSRRGFVDGRSLRLPTIAIRPGKANAATSSFVSGIVREPLNGLVATYPVPASTEVWIQSPQRVIENFIHAAKIDKVLLGDDRVISLPGLTTSIEAMIKGLEELSSASVTDLIAYEPDAFLQSIVLTWPPNYDLRRAKDLGFQCDNSAKDIIAMYIQEEKISI